MARSVARLVWTGPEAVSSGRWEHYFGLVPGRVLGIRLLRDSRGSSRVCADFVRRSFTRSGPPLVTGSITGISRRPEGVGMPARHAAEEPLQPELEAIATGRGPVARENGRSRERPATSAAEPPLTRLARQSPLASSSQRSRTLSATGSSAPRPAGTGRATARETRGRGRGSTRNRIRTRDPPRRTARLTLPPDRRRRQPRARHYPRDPHMARVQRVRHECAIIPSPPDPHLRRDQIPGRSNSSFRPFMIRTARPRTRRCARAARLGRAPRGSAGAAPGPRRLARARTLAW